MLPEIQKATKEKMDKVIEGLKKDLSKQRAGRAQPSLLEGVMVNVYGSDVPLSQISAITSEGPTVLAIKPWDKKNIPAIEKAIYSSELGLTPTTSNDIVRVPLPLLTEERRRELVKIVKNHVEQAKIAVRNIRRDANNEVRLLEKNNQASEDEARKSQDKIQELTDKSIKLIDEIFADKEQEIMKV